MYALGNKIELSHILGRSESLFKIHSGRRSTSSYIASRSPEQKHIATRDRPVITRKGLKEANDRTIGVFPLFTRTALLLFMMAVQKKYLLVTICKPSRVACQCASEALQERATNLQVKFLCLIYYHCMMANGGMEIRLRVFLTSELERDSCPGCFAPRERSRYIH